MEDYIKKQVPDVTPEEMDVLKAFAIEIDDEIQFLPSATINGREVLFEAALSSLKISPTLFKVLG